MDRLRCLPVALLVKNSLILESGNAFARFALSIPVAGGMNELGSIYCAALWMMSGSCQDCWASCWRVRAIGSQLDGLVLLPNVSPVCMTSVLWDIVLCIASAGLGWNWFKERWTRHHRRLRGDHFSDRRWPSSNAKCKIGGTNLWSGMLLCSLCWSKHW